MRTPTVLFPDQEAAAAQIEAFLKAKEEPILRIAGEAGTGKTHLLAEMARRHPHAILVAPTGKAATVLSARSGFFVSTIHSAIYNFRGLVDDQRRAGYKNPVFSTKAGDDLDNALVFLDESSMVGRKVAHDLLDTGAIMCAFGDMGQLKPIGDKPFFTAADITLTEIRRQALESPIIRQAHRVRRGLPYEADGDFKVFPLGTPRADFLRELYQSDIALCYLNATRSWLNSMKRSLLGKEGPLKEGEPIMCLRNSDVPWGKLCNGEIVFVAQEQDPSLTPGGIWVSVETGRGPQGPFHLPFTTFEGDEDFLTLQYEDGVIPFTVAYAATVHKSQGSEYQRVLLLDEYDRQSEKKEFLYTGITRAVKTCTVVQCLQ